MTKFGITRIGLCKQILRCMKGGGHSADTIKSERSGTERTLYAYPLSTENENVSKKQKQKRVRLSVYLSKKGINRPILLPCQASRIHAS